MARAGVRAGLAACALLVLLAGCDSPWSDDDDRIETARDFPPADRPVAPVGATKWSTEEARARVNEEEDSMDSSGVRPGMTVGEIGEGAGESGRAQCRVRVVL